jgi:hypothetical protein
MAIRWEDLLLEAKIRARRDTGFSTTENARHTTHMEMPSGATSKRKNHLKYESAASYANKIAGQLMLIGLVDCNVIITHADGWASKYTVSTIV